MKKKVKRQKTNNFPKLSKLKGFGLKKKKKKMKDRIKKMALKVDSRQLSGLAPMNGLDLYRSQLAAGIT